MAYRSFFVSADTIIRNASLALSRNKIRSILTSVGIIIGVSSVLVMIGIANSARMEVKKKIYSYGANGMSIGWSDSPITETTFNNVKQVSSSIEFASPYCDMQEIQVSGNQITGKIHVVGVNNDYFYMRDWKMFSGRYFDETEIDSSKNVAIIGMSVQKQMFGGYSSVGRIIQINNQPYRVIGILEETGASISGKDFDYVVMMPYTTSLIRIGGDRNISGIHLSVQNDYMVDNVVGGVRDYLRGEHHLIKAQKDDFIIVTSKDKMKVAEGVSKVLTYLLAGVASISLFVGGVGIMNIMLVSVTERTREIGIRMSVGAKRRDILIQFLSEAVILSVGGGIIGILIGFSIYYSIVQFTGWTLIVNVPVILISFMSAAFTGIFFGYYPARKAALMNPIDALRYE